MQMELSDGQRMHGWPYAEKDVWESRGSKEDDAICEGDRRSRLEVNNDE